MKDKKYDNLGELSYALAFEALKYLAENGPTLSTKEVTDYIISLAKEIDMPSDFRESYAGHRGPKYLTAMHFKLVGYDKAGFLKKSSPKHGYWTITEDGISLTKSNKSIEEINKLIHEKYWEWKKAQEPTAKEETDDVEQEGDDITVRDQLLSLDPYEFQDLTAGLLEAMGYFIDFNAPRGKDGGVDLVCYRDPLGAEIPRIKVQCKHRPEAKISRAEVSQFTGVINSNDEIGIYVTSGYFTSDAKRYAIEKNVHIRLIDGQELEDMWARYYDRVPEDKKSLMPIKFMPTPLTDETHT